MVVRQMDDEQSRDWFSHVDEWTEAQCKEMTAEQSESPEGTASLAMIELRVDEERRYLQRGTGGGGAVSQG